MNELWMAIVQYGNARESVARSAGRGQGSRQRASARLDQATRAVRLEIESLSAQIMSLEQELQEAAPL